MPIFRKPRTVLGALVLLILIAPSAADARRSARPLVVQATFHLAARSVLTTGAPAVFTNGAFVFGWLSTPSTQYPREGGVAIDDATGRKTQVTFPYRALSVSASCLPVAAGGPWLLVDCTAQPSQPVNLPAELYDFASHEWRGVMPSRALMQECSLSAECSLDPVSVGRRWLEWKLNFDSGCADHCGFSYAFQNLQTGQSRALRGWEPGGRVVPDLDSPSLSRRLCAPVTVPSGNRGFPAPGSLRISGTVVIDASDGYLQRCGGGLRRFPNLSYSTANNHVLMYRASSATPAIKGFLLPSLRRLTMPLPRALRGAAVVAVAGAHVYVLDAHGNLSRARLSAAAI